MRRSWWRSECAAQGGGCGAIFDLALLIHLLQKEVGLRTWMFPLGVALLLQGCAGDLRLGERCPQLSLAYSGIKDQGSLQARGEFEVRNLGEALVRLPLADPDSVLVDDFYVRVLHRQSINAAWQENDAGLGHSKPPAGALELRPGEAGSFRVYAWIFSEQPSLPEGEFAILLYSEDFKCRFQSDPFIVDADGAG